MGILSAEEIDKDNDDNMNSSYMYDLLLLLIS